MPFSLAADTMRSPLPEILLATLAGGILSLALAALLSFGALARLAPRLVGFAAGALLATALLDLIPEAARELPMDVLGASLFCGLLACFLLEKLALWRHDQGGGVPPAVLLVVVGDGVHNFIDGVLIAAAFLTDPMLGVTTAVAVAAHEIPQEISDFVLLLASGVSRRNALLLNGLCSLTMVAGGVVGYLALAGMRPLLPYLLVFAAAGFLYLAIADLLPALQRERRLRDFPAQLALLAGGAGSVLLHFH